MEQWLLIFLKFPEKGKVKTRLAQAMGEAEAASFYKELAEATVAKMKPLAERSTKVVIAYDPPDRLEEVRYWLPGPFGYHSQGPGDLGQRMSLAVKTAFQKGAKRVVVIGSDCPEIDEFTVQVAFQALSRAEIVLGPSFDGGYYLVGLGVPSSITIFSEVPWSTSEVFSKTVEKIKEQGISYEVLSRKSDVDTLEDYHRFSKKSISVIIPSFNEDENIEELLLDLIRYHKPDEIVVADGGSTDRTRQIAAKYAKLISSEKGRAVQMNRGAEAAHGEIFLFLHADTRLPSGALEDIQEALRDGSKSSGRFRMSFRHSHPLLRFYEYQTRFHFFSYGDQAFFMTREIFKKLRGFKTEVPFEDIDFYRRLLKIEKPVILTEPVVTSPRRFVQNGIIRQKFINIFLTAMYYLGFKTSWIHTFQKLWYKDVRKRNRLQSA